MSNQYCCYTGSDVNSTQLSQFFGMEEFLQKNKLRENSETVFRKTMNMFFEQGIRDLPTQSREERLSLFYTPIGTQNGNDYAVWGVCGAQTGRPQGYLQAWYDSTDSLDGTEFFTKIFGASYLNGNDFSNYTENHILKPNGETSSVDIEEIPNNNRSKFLCQILYLLCINKVVVLRLQQGEQEFNRTAKRYLLWIYSLLPSRIRKDFGFATFISGNRVQTLGDIRSTNMRLLVIDYAVKLSPAVTGEKSDFSVVTVGEYIEGIPDDDLWKNICAWYRIKPEDRDRQAVALDHEIKGAISPLDFLKRLWLENMEAEKRIAELETVSHSMTLEEVCATYRNEKLFEKIPRAANAFKNLIPQMLKEETTLEEEILGCVNSFV